MIRKIALESLVDIIIYKKYANLILREKLNNVEYSKRAKITNIVYGVLRNHQLCRYQWIDIAHKNVNEKIAILLDMSVFQIMNMESENYAVVSEAVNLAPKNFKGLVNAILRSFLRRGVLESDDILIKTSHPQWIYKLWVSHYGKEIADKICYENIKQKLVHARINTIKTTRSEIEKLEGVKFLTNEGFIADFNLVKHEYFAEGKYIIQDLSSQEVVNHLDLKATDRVLDCCAAPGTKTSQIGMHMQNKGVIISGDLHEHRVNLISRLMDKLGLNNVDVNVWDATKIDEILKDDKFDKILLDVPCSGLGVLSRKPEIKLNCKSSDIDEICEVQKKILNSASKLLKDNGYLVYSTCTLNKKENERQISEFLSNNKHFSLILEKTIFPFDGLGDGFYIAKLQKNIKNVVK
ncbi:MAG: 16S rRNA (cytosine(967)-C(5))-methyltransferase RsmB [Anaerorhabdus sp.]